MRRCDGITEDADLILVMERRFLDLFPGGKAHLITEFFGESGDIPDPAKLGTNLGGYQSCLERLRLLVESNYPRILAALA